MTQLSFGKKNNAGRSKYGNITVFSKGSLRSKTIFRAITNTFLGLKVLATIVKIDINSLTSKMVSLFVNSLGCWFYTLLPTNLFIFNFIKMFNYNFSFQTITYSTFWPRRLNDFKPHSFFCFLEIINEKGLSEKIKFIKSPGTRGLLVTSTYKDTSAIFLLPSLKVKVISNQSIAFPNHISNEYLRFLRSSKAGFYVNRGKKPTVRGTVKNSCDHPNGGRTRSLKLQMTPWGKVAKKSRHSSEIKKLKVLAKRNLKKNNTKPNAPVHTNIFEDKIFFNEIIRIFEDKKNKNLL